MKSLFQIELTKTLRYNPFRIILLLHFLFFLLGMFALPRIDIKLPFLSVIPLYQFPHVWNFTTWIGRCDMFTIIQIIERVDTIRKKDSGFGKIIV